MEELPLKMIQRDIYELMMAMSDMEHNDQNICKMES
jgi:hypothetical protein